MQVICIVFFVAHPTGVLFWGELFFTGIALAQHLPIIRFNPYGVFFLDRLSDRLTPNF